MHRFLLALMLILLAAAPSARAASGSHMTLWHGGGYFYYDPVNEFPQQAGSGPYVVTITTNSGGWIAGTYTANQYFPQHDIGDGTLHNLISFSAPASDGYWGNVPGPAVWSDNAGGGGAVGPVVWNFPVTHPLTGVTGAVSGLMVGDSITAFTNGLLQSSLQTLLPNASVSVTNQGVPGSKVSDWQPGQPDYTTAVNAANSARCTWATIMLGTNDRSYETAAQYTSGMQSLVNGLYHDIPTLRRVQVQDPPWVDPNVAPPGYDAAILSYGQSLAQLSRVTVGLQQDYPLFAANPQALKDGIHPTDAGNAAIMLLWQNSLLPVAVAAAPTTNAPADTFTPAPSVFAGTVTKVGNFIQQLITAYGIPAILIGIAICGWLFVKRIAKTEVR